MQKKILLVYPALGFAGSYVVYVPISLIYAVSEAVNVPGVEFEIFDCRIEDDWERKLLTKLQTENIAMVGLSVMSGMPVAESATITKMVKSCGDIPVVWGGAHPTILPEETLLKGGADYCLRGFGSHSFAELVRLLVNDAADDYESMEAIEGLCFLRDGEPVVGNICDAFEILSHEALPYHLIDPFIEKYFTNRNDRIFPIYSSSGCPYQCSFCISPIWYRGVKKKWIAHDAKGIVDHIEHLIERYGINTIYFYDDDTFVKVSHFMDIGKELVARNVNVQIGVRGIRVNEILKMKDEDFALLEKVGVKYVHVGMETGSQRMLDLMRKGIKVEESLLANRKLAQYPGITPMYNLMAGLPSETLDDLRATGRFMLELSRDNPRAIMFDPGKFVPYPGSELYDLAVKHGFKTPTSLEDWRNLDQEGDIQMPWYVPGFNKMVKMLQAVSYPLSGWESYLQNYPKWLQRFFKTAKFFYKPIAVARARSGWDGFLIESWLLETAKRYITKAAH